MVRLPALLIHKITENLQQYTNLSVSYDGLDKWLGLWYLMQHFQQYFCYIVAVSFIGGGKQSYSEKTTDLL